MVNVTSSKAGYLKVFPTATYLQRPRWLNATKQSLQHLSFLLVILLKAVISTSPSNWELHLNLWMPKSITKLCQITPNLWLTLPTTGQLQLCLSSSTQQMATLQLSLSPTQSISSSTALVVAQLISATGLKFTATWSVFHLRMFVTTQSDAHMMSS